MDAPIKSEHDIFATPIVFRGLDFVFFISVFFEEEDTVSNVNLFPGLHRS